ncbi:UNVERIFIED_CONTAM: hypothetical protein FKN15_028144 [Acipenser sinensis]
MEPHRKNASKTLVYFYVCAALFVSIEAQYEKYSFRSYPQSELMPLETAYGYALDQYAAENWKDSIKYLEMSLRIHRLLKDSESFCSRNCSKVGRDQQDALLAVSELRVFNHVLQRAFCLKKCKASSPVFSVAYPRKDILDAFYNRMPYRYLQFAYFQGNNLEKAVSAAHTFLQRNPEDPMMLKNLNYFKTLFEVDEYLIDLEEQPYQSLFVKSVKLYNAGDFRSSIAGMEQAVSEYFQVYELCLAACEGAHEVREFKDFYPAVADHYTDVLECKVKCEGSLAPNVGGFFVEKFVATMYHYLQFTYYKLKLYNAGDFRSSIAGMEQAVSEYFQVYELCLAACEGAHEVREFKDFYPAVADHYTDVLECKVKCEGSLAPNVGGFFVEKFVATMYHYLQFTYYKLNDVKNAAPCAASYLLFDPQDEIMLQNMVYYRFYREQWGLEDNDFRPRPEALQYFNQTTMQKQMLEFAQHYLQSDDEDVVSPEMTEISSDEPPDSEFEGVGDYEESIYAKWWQESKSKGDAGEPYV